MGEQSVSQDPSFVYGLFAGVYKPQLVRIALRLDLFTPLASGPADAQTVAQACGCSPVEGYLEALRSDKPYYPMRPWAQEAWLQSFGSMQPALDMWRSADFKTGPASSLRSIDLACGCAIKSLALAHANPLVQIDCVDSPEVLEVAWDLARRLSILSLVMFIPGDILTIDLEEGQYDAVLLGQITHYLTPEQNIALFKRVHASLVPTGVLVIDAPMTLDKSDEWGSFGSFFIWATGVGKAYSFAEYRSWLEVAEFTGVRQLGIEWLSAQKS